MPDPLSPEIPKWQADIARFGFTSIDTAMLRRDKRGLFPIPQGQCESIFGMIDKLCHELDVTRAELAYFTSIKTGQKSWSDIEKETK